MNKMEQIEERVRSVCYRCFKSSITCYCHLIRPVKSELSFIILQHPKESHKAIGTARMAHLCLQGSKLVQGISFQGNEVINSIMHDQRNHSFLLFPGPTAQTLNQVSSLEIKSQCRSEGKNIFVFVLDGTWDSAKKLFSENPALAQLPRISLAPRQPSIYKIRRQPNIHALSTLEAIHETLKMFCPETNANVLMETFQFMIETQLKFMIANRNSDSRHFLNSRQRRLKEMMTSSTGG